MRHFTLKRYSSLPQEKIFNINTDIENFHNIMPDYFKSLHVIEKSKTKTILVEKIKFLGITLNVKTKHVVIPPNFHEICILSGPIKGTVFSESYKKFGNGTHILIDVQLNLHGVLKLFGFLDGYIATKMSFVMGEFVKAAEKHDSANISYS